MAHERLPWNEDIPSGCAIVEGYPTGTLQPITGSSAASFHVDLFNGESRFINEIPIPLQNENAGHLPSYSMAIYYKLLVKNPGQDGKILYGVVDILDIKPRTLTKEQVKIVFEKKYSTGDEIKKKFLKKTFHGLPKIFDSMDCLADAYDKFDGSNWMLDQIKKVISMSFKSREYYELLYYFTDSFLDQFNDIQLMFIHELIKQKPEAFCFWEIVKGILGKTKRGGHYIFPHESTLSIFDINPVYGCVLDSQLYDPVDENLDYFSVTFPYWNYKKYKRAVFRFNLNKIDYYNNNILLGIELYTTLHKNFYIRGDTMLYVDRKTYGEGIDQCINIMYTMGAILIKTRDSMQYITKLSTETNEVDVMVRYRKIVCGTILLHSSFLDPIYRVALFSEISEIHRSLHEEKKRCYVLLSANENTAAYMSQSGTTYKAIDNFLAAPRWPAKGSCDVLVVAIDQFHKISTLHLRDLLITIPKHLFKKVEMVLCGSAYEMGATSSRGGGNLFRDFHNHFKIVDLKPELFKAHALYSTYCSVREKTTNLAFDLLQGGSWSALTEKIKNMTKGVKKNGVTTFKIFCSTKTQKKEILNKTSKSLPFKYESFHLGQEIYIPSLDLTGTISKAYRARHDGIKLTEIQTKDQFTLPGGIGGYKVIVQLDDKKTMKEIWTKEHKILPGYVMVISEYNSIPVDIGLFVIDPMSTTKMHILSAIKYCLHKFITFGTDRNVVAEIYKHNIFFPVTGLGDKLKFYSCDQESFE